MNEGGNSDDENGRFESENEINYRLNVDEKGKSMVKATIGLQPQ